MQKFFGNTASQAHHDSEHWMSVSDLMAGLMLVFLLMSISFMRFVLIERDTIRNIAVTYQDTQIAIYDALFEEFSQDLDRWRAELDQDTLEFRFMSPEVLFTTGSAELTPVYQRILADFFPRYLAILEDFKASIDEVRIEGHTSSVWTTASTSSESYFNNMRLSQDRTRAVLEYVSTLLPESSEQALWVRRHLAAVGYSSSRLVRDADGKEDTMRSRRVAFRVVTNSETQIRRIIEQ